MSKNYWRNREEENRKRLIKSNRKFMHKVQKNNTLAREEIQKQIEAFYGRYASKEDITMEEAKKHYTKLNIEDYATKAKRYVKEKNFTDTANEEMRLYNVTMRINRLELLKKNIELELLAMCSEEERMMLDYFTQEALYEYERLSGILGKTVTTTKIELAAMVNASFKNATWSTRLWDNQDALKKSLDRQLNRAMVQGLNPRETARAIRKEFDTSIYNSERLMRTEQARLRTDIFIDAAIQMDIKQYEWIAEPDACDDCAELDGKVFNIKDIVIGETGTPKHPNCLCSLSHYIDREEWEKDLESRGL